MKIALTGPFSEEYYITEETGKNVFCIYFSVYAAFLLSVREQGASAIIQFIILSLLEVFRSLGTYKNMEFE